MSLSKILGVIGSILILLSYVIQILFGYDYLEGEILFYSSIIFLFTGLFLVFLAVKIISNVIKNGRIYIYYLLFIIVYIIYIVIPLIYTTQAPNNLNETQFIVLLWDASFAVILCVNKFFLNRSFRMISRRIGPISKKLTKSDLFAITSTLYLIGAFIALIMVFAEWSSETYIFYEYSKYVQQLLFFSGAIIQIFAFGLLPTKLSENVTNMPMEKWAGDI